MRHLQGNYLKSFAKRSRAFTSAQLMVYQNGLHRWGVRVDGEDGVDLSSLAEQFNGVVLEIGFGDGDNLLALAKQNPDYLFVGAEVYQPGLLRVLCKIEQYQLNNIYLHEGDVRELLVVLPDHFLQQSLILFPDPWFKRRHHKRRLLQGEFFRLLYSKFQRGGELIIATDWEEYAQVICKTLLVSGIWLNCQPMVVDINSSGRLVITKFESKGIIRQRKIWQFHCRAGC